MADPFDTLALEPRFDLALDLLEARHRELSLALHPDRFAGREARERRQALSRAMEVNAAKRSLVDPISRAEALLARAGIERPEGKDPAAAPELLMAMMERREGLRDAAAARDKLTLQRLSDEVRGDEAQALSELTRLFAQGQLSDGQVRQQILTQLGALRYYQRFFTEAGAVWDELD